MFYNSKKFPNASFLLKVTLLYYYGSEILAFISFLLVLDNKRHLIIVFTIVTNIKRYFNL